MSTYISSNANRFYVALEASYGQAAPVTAANRFPALQLHARQGLQPVRRHDKTGTRTFLGSSGDARRVTAYEVQSYLTSWNTVGTPAYGVLFQAALGGQPRFSQNVAISSIQGQLQLQSAGAHRLLTGSAVACGNEIRFVTQVIDSQTFVINAPFKITPAAGEVLAPAVTYGLATDLPSITIYDYWDPITAASRVVTGAGVDSMNIAVNGDFHEFAFSGPACDLIDSSSYAGSAGGFTSYPAEPSLLPFDYSLVPGHLGEVWLGLPASRFLTLTGATIEIKNNLDVRSQEYGSAYPRALTPGQREVRSHLALLAQDDAQTVSLYAAAKQRTPIRAMLQLGQRQGQIMGVFMPKMVPEIPIYNDSKPRLQWEFNNNLAQGVADDEIFIAFA